MYLLKVTVGTSQLSSAAVTTSGTLIVAVPAPFKDTVKDPANTMDGAVWSTTVTTAVFVVALPFTSVAVTKTLFTPLLVQSNTDLDNVTTGSPQLSDFVSTTFDSTIVTLPFAFKIAVYDMTAKEGANSSTT